MEGSSSFSPGLYVSPVIKIYSRYLQGKDWEDEYLNKSLTSGTSYSIWITT